MSMHNVIAISIACMSFINTVIAIDSFSTYEQAEFYHTHSLQQWKVAYEALKSYEFQEQTSILEVGCRGGRIAANLAGRLPFGEVVATEMRGEGAIRFARQNHPKNLYPNLTFLDQDFLETHFNDYFDLVISFNSLHWYPDQMKILKKIYDALKPQGEIFFTIPGKPLPEIHKIISTLMNQQEWKAYFVDYVHPRKNFTMDEYMSFLTDTGFNPIEIKMKRCSFFFENKRGLIDW